MITNQLTLARWVPIQTFTEAAQHLYSALAESVRRRVVNLPPPQHAQIIHTLLANSSNHTCPAALEDPVAITTTESQLAILFSGGLDSLVLAALAADRAPPSTSIEYVRDYTSHHARSFAH
jgi:asparagine synthetase B (glutamine-hydrolysing)